MSNLSIASTQIRQIDGLYSLNDLHKASGAEAKHAPALFLRNEQAQSLITEINQDTDSYLALKTVHGGAGRGTFACKELVYAYGMWISAAFMLQVIRVFDAQQTVQALPNHQASSKRRLHIRNLVNDKVSKTGKTFSDVWHEVHAACQIAKIDDLTDDGYFKAIQLFGAEPIYDTPNEIQTKAPPTLPAPTEPEPLPFKFTPNARYLMTTDNDSAMTMRPLQNGEFIASIKNLASRILNDLAFSSAPDEALIDVISSCKQILTYRVEAADKRLGTLKRLTA